MKLPINDLRYFPHIIKENEDEIISEYKSVDEMDKFPLKHLWGIDNELLSTVDELFNKNDIYIFLKFRPKLSIQDSNKINIGVQIYENPTVWFDMNGLELDGEC